MTPEATPAGVASRRGRTFWIAVATAIGLALGTTGLALLVFGPRDGTALAALPGAQACPTRSPSAAFTGVSYGNGARVYRGPSRDQPIITTIPAGCVVGLVGYCLGEAMKDATSGTPDVRWFLVDGGGVTPSATLHGNPPTGTPVSRCRGDRPLPASIALGVRRAPSSPRSLTLEADGVHVDIVGFAAFYAPDPALPDEHRWQQISMTPIGASSFSVTWVLDRLRTPPSARDSVLVAAVACLGGQGPTEVVAVERVPIGTPDTATPITLDAEERRTAARAACVYPRSG